jgi:hypothetical protein
VRSLRNLFPLLGLGALLGCSMTLKVKGQMEESPEKFTGTATGYMNGSGKMHLVSSTGVILDGHFVYVTTREGSGVLTASDGRAGKFTFVSTGRNGTGHGELGGHPFVFTFGSNP